ncbi:MAG: phosphotransferase [Chloroflexi bacterium]|nr:phosphotransferase [Chloroflexota bacterium]
MPVETPRTVDELTPEYLSGVAARMLGDPSLEVTSFTVTPDPFEFPRFGEKQFFEIAFGYRGSGGGGTSTMILRVLPPMDAVMMLTGDTEHRELKAFETGLLAMVPPTFHVPYIDIVHRPEREQYWVFVEDVRPDMARLGMTEALGDETLRLILSHLAAFHAAFWGRHDVLGQPWLMRLERPVDYFYRCIVDILDGMKGASEPSRYIIDKWPWLQEGVLRLFDSLAPPTRHWMETLYREPERLLEKVRPLSRTLCHYDFDNRNLGIREGANGPQTVVIDWEIVGEGLSSADVGRFLAYQQPPNAGELVEHYLDELERHLGRSMDREEWHYGSELVTVAIWQIIGVQFGALVSTPTSPVSAEQRQGLKARVYSDIEHVQALVRKHRMA